MFHARAPELFEVPSECVITEKTDIWSLGCTLYAAAFGGCGSGILGGMTGREGGKGRVMMVAGREGEGDDGKGRVMMVALSSLLGGLLLSFLALEG